VKLLYLVHRIPYPPNRGDRIRSHHLLRFLAARHTVSLACLADEPTPPEHVAALKAWCHRVAVVELRGPLRWLRATASLTRGHSATQGLFESPELRKTVNAWTCDTNFDAAIAFCSSMTPYLQLPSLAKVPAIVDLVDVDSQKWFDYSAGASPCKRWLFRLEGRRVRRLEIAAAQRARALTTVSEAETELCRGYCAPTPVYGISNGVDLDYFGATAANDESVAIEPRCVFVGALDYRANVDGLAWFCREVWSELRERYPQANLTVVGRSPAASVLRLAEIPGVCLAADVPDVRPYLARATAVIAPLRVARGIQNKVLEALAARRAVVASSGALEGIELEVGRHALRADTPDEWIAALSRVFDDTSFRKELGAAGRAFVKMHHDWTSQLLPFEDLVSALAPPIIQRSLADVI